MELVNVQNLSSDLLTECAKILDSYWGGGVENRRVSLESSSESCYVLMNMKNYEKDKRRETSPQQRGEVRYSQEITSTAADITQEEKIADQQPVSTPGGAGALDVIIGHVKLDVVHEQCSSNHSFAKCGVITSVIIHQKYRQCGSGYGTLLMRLLEEYAQRRQIHYLYLWTSDAAPFYLKLGYQITERILEFTSVFRNLENKTVTKLENMLTRKLQNHLTLNNVEPERALEMNSDSNHQISYVYLKKRILDEEPLQILNKSQWKDLLCNGIPPSSSGSCIFLPRLKWAPQIGPSCGIQALRFCTDFFRSHFPHAPDSFPSGEDPPLTLLRLAISAGYSSDGEIFNIFHLLKLISQFYGLPPPVPASAPSSGSTLSLPSLQLSVTSFSSLSWNDITSILSTPPSKTGLIILPYDRSVNGSSPCQKNGRSAHYGVICGYLESFSSNSGNDEEGMMFNHKEERGIEEMVTTREDLLSLKWGRPASGLLYCEVQRFLIMVQGMSLAPIVAPYSSFLESNQQLFADRSQPLVSSNSYILPEGGPILADLCLIIKEI